MADEKKIIIDEDWKSQVQAEKDAAAKSRPAAEPSGAAPGAPSGVAADVPMPPASLELLLTMLATEALVALGQMPHPATGQVQVHPNQAKYLIDTIEVLKEKTKGNLNPGEQQLIETLLHQLRIVYVDVAGAANAGAAG
jgi:hypothetical protein